MLEDKIIACCKKLRLSRNLADMAMCKRQVFLEKSRPIILESFF